MATGSGSNNGQDAAGDGAAAKLHRGLLGLAAASVAITMTVSEPPPGLDGNAYCFVALPAAAGVFSAGMNQVQASVWAAGGDDRRHVAGKEKKLMHALVVAQLIVAAGITAASLLLWVCARALQL